MRPPKIPQGTIRCPVNRILGTEANVRVVREILLADAPLSVSELARRTSLQASGLSKICDSLEELGVVEAVGRGRSRQFRGRMAIPIVSRLAALFNDERNRYNQIQASITDTARQWSGAATSAWIEGSFATDSDQPGDSVVVGLLTTPDERMANRDQMWASFLGVQEQVGVSLELSVVTEGELKSADDARFAALASAIALYGKHPAEIARPEARRGTVPSVTRGMTNESVDDRQLRIAVRVAEQLAADPSLVDGAMRNVERQLLTASTTERLALREWLAILRAYSAPRIRKLLVRDDAQGRRLRQSIPFDTANLT
jgi:hypothetical protein